MHARRAAVAVLSLSLSLTGCLIPADGDHDGTYTGAARRFSVDSIVVPTTNAQAREYAGDLDGDGKYENHLGQVTATLASTGLVTTHAPDMIAAGAIASSVIITADDFTNDPSVSVLYLAADGDSAALVGGALEDGAFVSHRPGRADVRVPVFVDADPSTLSLISLQLALQPDGNGGFDAIISGALPDPQQTEAAHDGIVEMMTNYPSDHVGLMRFLDVDPKDWSVSYDEVNTSSLIMALLAPDLTIEGQRVVSFGFRAHLSPCELGDCATSTPQLHCFDRVRDGDETDIDCGGSCRGCVAGASCGGAADCETAACDAGTCGPPSCSNGVRDGFEVDVDCGAFCGKGCAVGQRCWGVGDCASGQCGAPCGDTVLGCLDFGTYDTCR